ncbi:MAG TPA: TldD/PmbA family protein [Dehalococcoidia bacterium]|nr:TldD/PmbA family protein [Dehalococcoidia bacterium]
MGEQELQRMAREVLNAVDADQAEVLIYGGTSALTRFANNYIHQNVQETDLTVRVRAVLGKKTGVAATDAVTPEGLRAVAERSVSLAKLQQDNEHFTSLPGPQPIAAASGPIAVTAECSAEQRAAIVATICRSAAKASLVAAGAFRTGESETAVMNSLGVWAYHADAAADINTVVMGETSSGYSEVWTRDVSEIDGAVIAAEAIDKAQRGANPQALEPGEYDVILEEYAVADLMDFFALLSFGSQAFLEKRSFMTGRIGQRIMGENVSIWDDGLSANGLPAPFDAEGVPRQRIDFVRDGVAKGVAWDTYYGAMGGEASTGHALPAGETYGAIPTNLFMGTGDATKAEMLASTKRGIWVSRFWYTRTVHPLNVVLTGMTRDGTFLIEDGKIVAPVANLRFTQSYLEAMNSVEAIGRESRLMPHIGGACRVPALKIKGWNFTGATQL